MKIVVLGSSGLLGSAIAAECAARGHRVLRSARRDAELCIDYRFDLEGQSLRTAVRGADIVVNAVGILVERDGNTWDTVHRRACEALAAACADERVARVIHISALGVGTGIPGKLMASKLAAEEAFAQHGVDYAIIRPGLLVDPRCPSTQLFRFLARLRDVAHCVARIAEYPKALRRVIELSGARQMSYRTMLAEYRQAQGKGPALWLPLPWWLIKLAALPARFIAQKVFSIDTLRMLQAGSAASRNETSRWLGGRDPAPMLGAPDTASASQLRRAA
jgi:uncharacterized protein YbjT (DUF2867 family)